MKRFAVGLILTILLCSVWGAEEKQVFRVVTNATFPPYEYYEGNEIVGIDIDIIREVLRRNGKEIQVEDMKFDAIIAAIKTGKGDIAASGLTITEERKREVDFTLPYVTARQVIIVRKGFPEFTRDEMKNFSIGVQHGTTGDLYVAQNITQPQRFDDGALAIAALVREKLDVVVLDQDPALVHVSKNPGLVILPEALTFEEYAFAIAKGNPDLLKMLNETIAAMHEDGTVESVIKRHKDKNSETAGENQQMTEEPAGFTGDLYVNFVKDQRWKYLLDGFWVTIIVAGVSVLLGILIGFLVAVIRSTADLTGKYKIADVLCRIYLTVIRGTPVVLQLMIIYFVIFSNINVDKILVAIIAFGVNSGAYVAEIIRSGIMAIDRGQMEAGRSLGLSYTKTLGLIILPQAFKNVLPALGNEFIVLLKETSVCGFIALQDLTKGGDIIRSQTYNAFLPLIVVALIYLVLVTIFSRLLGMLEKRLKKNEQ